TVLCAGRAGGFRQPASESPRARVAIAQGGVFSKPPAGGQRQRRALFPDQGRRQQVLRRRIASASYRGTNPEPDELASATPPDNSYRGLGIGTRVCDARARGPRLLLRR